MASAEVSRVGSVCYGEQPNGTSGNIRGLLRSLCGRRRGAKANVFLCVEDIRFDRGARGQHTRHDRTNGHRIANAREA